MRIGSVLFLTGVCIILQFKYLPEIHYFILLICILILLHKILIARYAIWFLGGCIWTIYFSNSVLEQRLLPELESKELYISGKVLSLTDSTDFITHFNFNVKSATDTAGISVPVPKIIRLSWYSLEIQVYPEDELEITVRLKRPHGYFNPGGFDYETWLFREGIGATGYITALNLFTRSSTGKRSISRYRLAIRTYVNEFGLSYDTSSELAQALLIGERSELQEDQKQLLYNTGTAHLIAISGLHIGLVAAISFLILKWIWSATIIGLHYYPAKIIASILSMGHLQIFQYQLRGLC